MSSLREQILSCNDIESEEVTVNQWGVTLLVKGMSGRDRAKFMEQFAQNDGSLDYEAMYPSLVIACACDAATGERVFDDGDAAALNSKSGAALETVAAVALRLSGMGKESEKDLGKG